MIGKVYIDGIDIFEVYKIFVSDEGFNELISYASLKSFDINDWPEEDGIEPDLSNPVLDSKDLTITFRSLDSSLTENFILFLSDLSYHDFTFDIISYSSRLRLDSQPDKSTYLNFESFSLKFSDDFPLSNYTYLPPVNGIVQDGFYLDNNKFSDYGVYVCEGYYDEVLKIPSVKKRLILNFSQKSGLIYDNSEVKYQSKECKLTCVLKANNISDFWRNYNAFLYDLIRPGERLFTVNGTNDSYNCYYKSQKVSLFDIVNSAIWCEFSLTLVFTNFRPKTTISILATQDYDPVTPEGFEAFIPISQAYKKDMSVLDHNTGNPFSRSAFISID